MKLALALALSLTATEPGSSCLKPDGAEPSACEIELMGALLEKQTDLELEKIESDYQSARYNAAQEMCASRVIAAETEGLPSWLLVALGVVAVGLGVTVGIALPD